MANWPCAKSVTFSVHSSTFCHIGATYGGHKKAQGHGMYVSLDALVSAISKLGLYRV